MHLSYNVNTFRLMPAGSFLMVFWRCSFKSSAFVILQKGQHKMSVTWHMYTYRYKLRLITVMVYSRTVTQLSFSINRWEKWQSFSTHLCIFIWNAYFFTARRRGRGLSFWFTPQRATTIRAELTQSWGQELLPSLPQRLQGPKAIFCSLPILQAERWSRNAATRT